MSILQYLWRLRDICEAENVDVGGGDVLHQAVDTCEGDLRRALTALQCCQRLLGKITAEGLVEVPKHKMLLIIPCVENPACFPLMTFTNFYNAILSHALNVIIQ